ncbi:hypothetical protein CJ030_MR7G014405 [Morella rubra]|uniref:Uncharacterized protein n=1 Tax=Morella rubra TaxID=262757 RepID=A0A6A1V4S3_9ROSI|nr:hypothetical protein CJ030_MR7G014405 [Morella rubra]
MEPSADLCINASLPFLNKMFLLNNLLWSLERNSVLVLFSMLTEGIEERMHLVWDIMVGSGQISVIDYVRITSTEWYTISLTVLFGVLR